MWGLAHPDLAGDPISPKLTILVNTCLLYRLGIHLDPVNKPWEKLHLLPQEEIPAFFSPLPSFHSWRALPGIRLWMQRAG